MDLLAALATVEEMLLNIIADCKPGATSLIAGGVHTVRASGSLGGGSWAAFSKRG